MSRNNITKRAKMVVPANGKEETKIVYGQTPDGVPVKRIITTSLDGNTLTNDTISEKPLLMAIERGHTAEYGPQVWNAGQGTVQFQGGIRHRKANGQEEYTGHKTPKFIPYPAWRQVAAGIPLIGPLFRQSGGRIEYFR